MKSEKEIKEMITKCTKLRGGMPECSIFGDNNWKRIDGHIKTLTECLALDADDIQGKEDVLLDALDEVGEDWDDNPRIQVYDWILEKVEDDLVTDEDLEVFCKQEKEA